MKVSYTMRAAADGVMEVAHPRGLERELVDQLKQHGPSDFLVFFENQPPS
jgi:hypothetical protein